MSPISAKLLPAPAAGPLTAVTIGQCRLRRRRRNGWNPVSSAAPALLLPGFCWLRPCKLAPVQNARPAPVRTTQRTSAFLSSIASSASARPASMSMETAFMTSWWSSFRIATGPSKSSVQCLNCMVSSHVVTRVGIAVRQIDVLQPYLIFKGSLSMLGLEHLMCVIQKNGNAPMSGFENIFDLSGRVAVITGGNGGIGLGIAQALALSGCNVSIWGRNAEKNESAAATMAAGPGKVDTRVCDITDPASVKAAMQTTLDRFGRVDGCFANAGIGGGGRRAFIDRTEEEWRKMFATNLDGVFHVFQAAARHMTERATAGDPFGRLVATSSLASLFGTARNEHYAATKAAINALCRALAVELARQGVTANAILPGWIKSEMTAGIMANEKFVANVMPRIPVRRFREPEDFGGIAVYLMSKASSYHTADCLVIDGGYTAF